MVRMKELACSIQRHELGLIHFQVVSNGSGARWSGSSKAVDPLAALAVVDGAENNQRTGSYAGFLEGLAPGRLLMVGPVIGQSLGDTPRCVPVVRPCRMDQ